MSLAPSTPSTAAGSQRVVLLGAIAALVGLTVAVYVKSRCGMPAGQEGQYLRQCYSDIPPLWFAERLHEGAVPYLDHPVEYPPLTGLVMWLAAVPSASMVAFWWWTVGLLAVAAGITGGLLARAVGLRRTLVFAAAPTYLLNGAVNWDLPSIALAVGGLIAHRRGKDGWAGVLLGLGVAAKLWPALLLPAVVLAAGVLRGRGAGVRTAAAAIGAWALVNVPLMVVAPEGWSRFIVLSRERPADWDSLWRIVPGWFGSVIDTPQVNLVVGIVTLVGCAALLGLAVRWDPPERWHLVGLPVVAWFLIVGKVWSPQFTLWLLPLLALALPPVGALVALAVADVAVSLTRFPYLASVAGIEGGGDALPFEVAVAIRAVVVAVVAVWGWRREVARAAAPRSLQRLRPTGITA